MKKKSKNIFFIIWQKKTKKKIIYLLHVACHFTKEHQKNKQWK